MAVDIRQLRALLAVAESGSIRKAASALHVAQPSLSQTIRALERELGVELFVRSTRGVEMTYAGRQLSERVQPILRMLDDAVEAVRADGLDADLRLGLVAGSYAAAELTGPLIASFAKMHPRVRLRLVELNMAEQGLPLARGEVDLALTRLPNHVPDIEMIPLIAELRSLVFAPTNPLAHRKSISAEELLQVPMVSLARAPAKWRSFWTLNELRGDETRETPVEAVTVDEFEMALALNPHAAMTAASSLSRRSAFLRGILLPAVPPSIICIARRHRDRRPAVEHFIAHAQAFCRNSTDLMTDSYSVAQEPTDSDAKLGDCCT